MKRFFLSLIIAINFVLSPVAVAAECPLCDAAILENLSEIKRLLDNGANIDSASDNGITALMYAAYQGHTEIIKSLLDNGANPDLANNGSIGILEGRTALMTAARKGHTEIVKILLDKKANPDLAEKDSWTALIIAAFEGHTEIVKILLEKGANPDLVTNEDYTALTWAAYKGHAEIAKVLLEKGANPDLVNSDEKTAWYYVKDKPLTNQVFQEFLATKSATKKQPATKPKNTGKNERYYSDLWCESQGGKSQARLADNTLADCITDEYAVEFDFGKPQKSYECAGQAAHYSSVAKLKPLCILIRSVDISVDDFSRAVGRITPPVEVQCMNVYGEMFSCPVVE